MQTLRIPVISLVLSVFLFFQASCVSLDGPAETMAAGTYPRATRLSSGNILACYTAFDGDENVISTLQSTDNGVTWTALGEVTRGVGDIDNCNVLQLPNGHILAAFRNHDTTTFRLTVCYSTDLGATWTFLSQLTTEPFSSPNGLWEPFLRLAADGSTIQAYYSRENSAADQDNLLRTSTDNGLTWSSPITVSGGTTNGRDGMTGVAELNGVLYAVFETTETGPFTIKSVTSSDDGATWGNRGVVYTPANGDNAGAPQIAAAGSTLAVTFMTDEDTHTGSILTGGAVKLVTGSGDGNWGNKITVGAVQSSWAGVMELSTSEVLVVFDHGGNVAQKVAL